MGKRLCAWEIHKFVHFVTGRWIVAALLARLKKLESDVRYQECPKDDEPEFRYVPGEVPILISAPHGAVHTRAGRLKEEDEFTAGIARLVAELTNTHVLYARRISRTDPNWDSDAPYKDQLRKIVEDAKIRFVLDLHGASAKRKFGVALGTMNGESCPEHHKQIVQRLENCGFGANGSGLDRLDVDNEFTGKGRPGQNTIIRFAWEELGTPAAQVELHASLRIVERRSDASQEQPFEGEASKIEKVICALAGLVRSGVLL